jgi:hypothetical protein
VDYVIKMLSTDGNREIVIKDLYKKTSVEEQSFTFDKIYDESTSNQDIFEHTYKNIISKAFDNINCCMVAMGVNGSGKGFTLFGDDFKGVNKAPKVNDTDEPEGLLYKVVESILEQAEDLGDTREISLTASFYDLFLDRLRDLAIGIPIFGEEAAPEKPVKPEGRRFMEIGATAPELEILDIPATQGAIAEKGVGVIVRGGTVVPIEHPSDIGRLMEYGFSTRERMDIKSSDKTTESRAHLIMNLCLKMTDRENPNFPPVNS